ncbi:hypothetical protein CHUAL_002245 [Chamberlinius hualienensis]
MKSNLIALIFLCSILFCLCKKSIFMRQKDFDPQILVGYYKLETSSKPISYHASNQTSSINSFISPSSSICVLSMDKLKIANGEIIDGFAKVIIGNKLYNDVQVKNVKIPKLQNFKGKIDNVTVVNASIANETLIQGGSISDSCNRLQAIEKMKLKSVKILNDVMVDGEAQVEVVGMAIDNTRTIPVANVTINNGRFVEQLTYNVEQFSFS